MEKQERRKGEGEEEGKKEILWHLDSDAEKKKNVISCKKKK